MFNYYNGNYISMAGQKETSYLMKQKIIELIPYVWNISVFRGLGHSHVWWEPLGMHDLHG